MPSRYHVAYKKWLDPAAKALREAADLSDDKDFAQFLRMRADALLSDDYYPSDLKWLDLKNPKIDVIFAPYETYLDGVLGVKTSYEAALLIRNQPESAKLELYQKYVPDIQDALPLAAADRPSKRGQPTPMEVMDAPFRTGDLLHGYQAVADNLPNDPRVHDTKGTKKIFFKNFMDARVNNVVLPLAKYLMPEAQAAQASGEGYLAAVVLHEISHGLGPAYSRINGKQVPITEAIGPVYSALEEAKADVVGMYGLAWLMDHGALPKEPGTGILLVVRGRHFSLCAIRRGRGAWARRDDGVQLPAGTEGDEARGRKIFGGFRAHAGGHRKFIERAAHD